MAEKKEKAKAEAEKGDFPDNARIEVGKETEIVLTVKGQSSMKKVRTDQKGRILA